jgi:response regulator RpfG family c-di-GMP phosphodiesterase
MVMANTNRARVLVIDEESYIQEILKGTLENAGFECVVSGDAETGFSELEAEPFDITVVDVRVRGMSVTEVIRAVRARREDVKIIVASANNTASAALEAIRAGAYDYIVKPLNLDHVLLSANRALEQRRLERDAREYQQHLEQLAEQRAAETRRMFYLSTRVLVRLFELKSPYKSGHPLRVAEMSRYVAHELRMTEEGVRKVYLAALLADVGMLAVHEGILAKPEPLTDEEYRRVQTHIEITEEVLKPLLADDEVLKYIHHHHERFDGSGYPDGLKGSLIPLASRIVSVVESFVAMTQDRPYRNSLSPEEALEELQRCVGTQFDPQVVSVFTALHESTFKNFDRSDWVLP